MNPAPQDPSSMYYSPQAHMSGSTAPPVTSSMAHYPPPQPPLLPPGPAQYSASPHPYSQYGYANGLTSPPAAPVPAGMPPNVLPLPGQPGMPSQYNGFDTTGQVAPPGMKPRVTATLWEDEGSLCFQVEARGICVARREDNHMINGTKLLNVAGMTRGRRDGILKSEKVRHVVKIGPMHLKGVWIPFERALDFANKEKITELLYPLFVHNIGALLYHPTNQTRTSQVMQAAERRKAEQTQMRNGQPPLPSLQQHHHHHSMGLPGPQPPLPSHRPSLDRAHTFPTPPTSASSVMGNMGADNYQWPQQQGMNGAQGTNPMSIDTSISNTRSMPATPATTPPGSSIQSMSAYPPASQPYDASRQQQQQPPPPQQQQQQYNPPPLQSPYQTANTSPQDRSMYSQQGAYVKTEMGPPSSRPSISGAPGEQEQKAPSAYHGQGNEHVAQGGGAAEDEGEHEHETEYTHDRTTYDNSNNQYNYSAPQLPSLQQSEHPHLSPEMAGAAGHQGASGRSTPRSAAPPQAYYPQSGYNTPPRGAAQSGMYNVVSNDRASTNGTNGGDVYASQPDMNNTMHNGYAPAPLSAGLKRGRDDEDERPLSGGPGMDIKRRKTLALDPNPAQVYQPPSATTAPTRRR
ncbi:apses-domain-containing protein [Cryphonectria parasitica EP155]|uniref:Apses-domain-containing protein n=1 Tax=Cryphonectria parasitica (strain ATCC 38755 / EP155) TaxID=660469 RepID=A0A9P5CKM2_CRYP1|nr:apses-domain-containing protein [Cryphonectria parasitica EP155]KAF3761121.1 apses-domain-containing protein [Cryphonectria parasitica EP155]